MRICKYIICFILSYSSLNAQNQFLVDSLKNLLPELNDESKIKILLEISSEYLENSPQESIEYGNDALKLAEEYENKPFSAEALFYLANSYSTISDFDKALNLAHKALAISEELDEVELITRSYRIISHIYSLTNNLDEAINIIKHAIDIQDSRGFLDPWLINNYGALLYDKGDYQESLKCMFRVLSIVETKEDSADIGLVYSNIGELYSVLGDYEKALEYSLKGFNIEKKFATKANLIDAYLTLGNLYLQVKNYQDSKEHLVTGLNLSKEIDSKIHTYRFYYAFSDYYKSQNDFKTSLQYLQNYTELKDSIALVENSQTSKLITKYETEKKDVEIELLQKDNEIQTLYRNSFIGGFIFLCILSIGLYNRYRFKSKANKELTIARQKADEANQIIQNELEQAYQYLLTQLPEKQLGKIKTDWEYKPASHLGGDIFGYHWVDEKNFALYLIDVSGHGVGATLMSVAAHNLIKSQSLKGVDYLDPSSVLNALNTAFPMDEHNDKYFTIWYGIINIDSRKVVCSSAMHPAVLIFDSNNTLVGKLNTEQLMIGAFEDTEFENKPFEMPDDAKLYLFSDGTFEILDENMNILNLDGLADIIEKGLNDVGRTLENVYTNLKLRNPKSNFDDDYTMVEILL